ncbi:MAG: putative membrane protein [Cellvibrionaceae bacterium]
MKSSSNLTASQAYKTKDWIWLFFKGVAMGAADVVPGVSGGTIAFIVGIYARLLNALQSLTPMALVRLFNDGFAAFWEEIDGRFLLTLFAGIIGSVLTFANLISYGLEHYPILIWSFFFGLVLASILYLVRQTAQWRWHEGMAIIIGSLLALLIVSLRPTQLPAEWWMLMIAGAIAICAMILPGISGSFILLLMGMYEVFIEALQTMNIVLLLSFTGGCIVGLLGFSHLLSWLLARYESIMYALLTGFLVGSLKVLWPWKEVVETTLDRHGDVIPLVQNNVMPARYTEIMAEPALLLSALLCVLFGLVLVLLLERIGDSASN